jgi:hypothetical protein
VDKERAHSDKLYSFAAPLRFRHMFIVTYGRSGSTLLNGVLNSIPGVCVRGENWNALFHVFCAAQAAAQASSQHLERPGGEIQATIASPVSPWYGAAAIEVEKFRHSLVAGFVDHVLSPPEDAVALGFKEVRYDIAEMSDAQFDAYVDFLLEAFDRACIIFNVRRWRDVARSQWWAANPFARWFVRNCDARFERCMQRHPSSTFKVKYENYAGNPDNLKPLFAFLGATFDRELIAKVLATPHSYRFDAETLEYRNSRSWLIATLELTTRWLRRLSAWRSSWRRRIRSAVRRRRSVVRFL